MGTLVSLALTAGWAAFTHDVLSVVQLDGVPGMGTLLGALGVLVTLAGDVVIFFVVLVRLPHADVPRRVGLRGAILAAVGFEILKIVGTYTIAASAGSATAGPFAGLLAVLVWIQLVSRYLLFCAAWTAERPQPSNVVPEPDVATQGDAAACAIVTAPAVARAAPLSPAAVGAGLAGAGAVAGAAVGAAIATAVLRRRTLLIPCRRVRHGSRAAGSPQPPAW
jgi:membrane protein